MAETLEDFWRMCWEHNSAIIVMISQSTEQGKVSSISSCAYFFRSIHIHIGHLNDLQGISIL